MVIATAVELAASYLMEWTMGGWQWDYTRFAFQFQGRIALNPSIRFGIGGMVFLYLLQPLFERLAQKAQKRKVRAAALILALVLAVDVLLTWMK